MAQKTTTETTEQADRPFSLGEAQNALFGLLSHEDEAAAGGEDQQEPQDQQDESGQAESDTPSGSDEQHADTEVAGDEPDAEPEPQAEPLYKVKADGEELEVTLDELQRGYSRSRDYTQKTQALAETRKALEQEMGQTREQRARYADLLKKVGTALERMQGEEPDWDKIRVEQPDQYPAMWTDWQRRQKALADVDAERAAVEGEQTDDLRRRHQEFVAEERKRLHAAIPDWRDPAKERDGLVELAKFARERGFSDADLAAVADHRVILLLRDAMAGARLAQRRPEVRQVIGKKTIKPARPGASSGKPAVAPERKRAAERFARSGSMEDAAVLIRQALESE